MQGPLFSPQARGALASAPIAVLFAFLLVSFSAAVHAGPEGRTRTFCGLYSYACGGHLQPQCTSGSICDAGHNSYTINRKINCPWPIADQTITAGCYDRRPNCGDCSAAGQIPCPAEAEPFCDAGCDAGLISHPQTTLCGAPGASGIPPGDIGAACGPGFSCKSGLACDELQLKCVGKVQAGHSCLNPFVPCDDGLSCNWGVCAHMPARLDEPCDVASPCGEGLFCQAGIPQRCKPLRKVGQGCSVFNPCVDGAFCDACIGEGCNSVLQCWPEGDGLWTEESCLALRWPALHNQIQNDGAGLAHTFSVGNAGAIGVGESQELGVMYGDAGRYGCFTTLCGGINIDLGIEHFVSFGFMESADAVNGASFITFEEVQLGNVLNYAAVQVFPRGPGELVPNGAPIGTNAVFAVGTPTNPYPFSGGAFVCDTVLQEFPVPGSEGGITIVPNPGPGPGSGPNEGVDRGTGAVLFNGEANSKLAISSSTTLSVLTFSTTFSISLWISPSEESQSLSFLNKEGEYQIGLRDGELAYSIANTSPGWAWVNSGFFPPVDKWTHITLTYDAGSSEDTNLHLYVNGHLKHALPGVGSVGDYHSTHNQLQLGGRQLPSETPVFKGVLDEVRLWSRALSTAEVRANLGGYDSSGLLTGLVSGWNFNESAGDALLSETDSDFDTALNSVVSDLPPVRIEGAKANFEGALYFDGAINHTGVADESAFAGLLGTNTFTLEAWVMPSGVGASNPDTGGAHIVSKSGEFILSRDTAGNLVYELATIAPGWGLITTDINLPEDSWSHIALVYDGSGGQLLIYLNAEPVYSIAANGGLEDTDITDDVLRIGYGFDGYIDEVRLWSVARTQQQLEASYNTALAGPESQPLWGYWKFNENNLALNFDSSGKHNLALYGGGNLWESPLPVNVLNEDSYPKTLLGDPCATVPLPDKDADGICDNTDNCPLIANADQADADSDGEGNLCETATTSPLISLGALSASNRTVSAGSENVVMLRFSLDANYASSSFDSISLTATGSGNELTAITAVKLWVDANANGTVDSSDQVLGQGAYTSNNGNLTIQLDETFVLPFGLTQFIVSYDFN